LAQKVVALTKLTKLKLFRKPKCEVMVMCNVHHEPKKEHNSTDVFL
jgi:hypothetical protein